MTPRSAREGWIEQAAASHGYHKTLQQLLRDAMAFADTTTNEGLQKLIHPSCYSSLSHGEQCCFDTLCKQRNDALADAHPMAEGQVEDK